MAQLTLQQRYARWLTALGATKVDSRSTKYQVYYGGRLYGETRKVYFFLGSRGAFRICSRNVATQAVAVTGMERRLKVWEEHTGQTVEA